MSVLILDGPDNTTWIHIFDIFDLLRNEDDKHGADVIFGIRVDGIDKKTKLSIQIEGHDPMSLFDYAPNDQVSVCLIPGTYNYAIIHLHDGKPWLHTNWKNPVLVLELMHNHMLKLKHGDAEHFPILYYIKTNDDSLSIYFENYSYKLKLKNPPGDENIIFEPISLNLNLKDAFYLKNGVLHFNEVTVTSPLDVKETTDISNYFNCLDDERSYFLTFSTSFIVPPPLRNKDILLFSVPKEGVKDSITKSSFSLPTSYPFVCWTDSGDIVRKVYLFVISIKYPNYPILGLVSYMFSRVVLFWIN
jgi:hypothetical protein